VDVSVSAKVTSWEMKIIYSGDSKIVATRMRWWSSWREIEKGGNSEYKSLDEVRR
jgi:hypothetical protein